ncbi:ribokinase [Kaistia algarum]|uniref:PfkB family carbohydrate kinase n=1 Tax=Kaistia algarum TaxID=2083279 RepID=UPI000CE8739C|nr:PfkB family carbohydrate kinase [Kaistia algarum]MCX5514958.1 PfkB family carbohydrate kinase [Kaistia algarum]PPE79703.1 ribokinase [Kaistia algarum]
MFLVLGNATIDESMAVTDWPSPGQTVAVGPPARDLGGKGANQAIVLARTGAPVNLVAAIGRDAEGDWVAAAIVRAGLDTGGLLRVDEPTDRSLIFVAGDGENAIASTTAAARSIEPAMARAALQGLGHGDGLLLQGNLTLDATKAALEAARAQGVVTILNPSPMQAGFAGLLPLIDLLVLNEGEALQLGGAGEPGEIAEGLSRRSRGTVVLTLGGRGAVLRGVGIEDAIPGMPVTVLDTTGAGDTFTGVMIGGLHHRKLPLRAAVAAANRAAALTVQRKGTLEAFPSEAEIEAIFATA